MNVYDSELVGNLLDSSGYTKTDKISDADAIFINTCAIREKAEDTVHNRLDSLHYLKKKNPSMIIGLLGCMAKNLKDEILVSKPYVDIILGPDSYRKIPELINKRKKSLNNIVDTKLSKFELYEDIFPNRKSGINAWISISRGCDKFCTFCIVPFTRGRERNRSIDSIINEAAHAVSEGFPEVTLLGQNVNSFRTEDGDFADLLDRVANVKGIDRIRYTSPHPSDINDRVLDIMSKHSNICNNIHLPLQAGSNYILKRMNRTYTRSEYLSLVQKIKKYMPDCTLSTDIIVGFPGETDEHFSHTVDIMKEVRFNSAFMFKYSSRPGTKAENFSDHLDEKVKQSRLEKIIEIQKKITTDMNMELIGTVQDVIVEKESKKSSSCWAGRTMGNTWVIFDKGTYKVKDKVKLLIYDAQGVSLFGKKINLKEPYYETN